MPAGFKLLKKNRPGLAFGLQGGIQVTGQGVKLNLTRRDTGEAVTVQFRDQKVSTTAKDGKWQVKLRKLQAGGPDSLMVSGKNQIERRRFVGIGRLSGARRLRSIRRGCSPRLRAGCQKSAFGRTLRLFYPSKTVSSCS